MTNPGRTGDAGELRRFGLGLATIMAAGAALALWRSHAATAVWLGIIMALVLTAAVARPVLLRPVQLVMLKVGHVMGWVNTRLLLAIIFFGVFTPMAVVMRLMGRDPLQRKFDPRARTYWIKRPEEKRGRERYEQMH